MDVVTFWTMIETARNITEGDIEKQTQLLIESLSQKSEEEILEFDRIMGDMLTKANRGILWDAAIFIHCGCSEDGFKDFRAWLIAQGGETFKRAIENPESLVDVVGAEHRDDVEFEVFAYIASRAYRHKTGHEIPYEPGEYKYTQLLGPTHDEDELSLLFPRLTAKLGACDEWWDSYLKDSKDEE